MLKCILCAMGVLLSAAYAHAVSSSPTITYQGELIDGGTPVDDTCDFAFGLWDDPSAGTQVGFATIPAVDVVAGKFTVNVSFFPAGAFDGSPRWIEINVCCASPCDPSFTTLTPRQFLAAAPSSIRAIEGVGPPNALAVDESGRVGIGAAPNSGETAILQVTGGVRTTDFLQADGVITSGSTITVGGTSGVDGVMFPDGTLQITAATGGGTLDDAYDSRGAGAGRTIIADTGPVNIAGTDGLVVTGDIQGDRSWTGITPRFSSIQPARCSLLTPPVFSAPALSATRITLCISSTHPTPTCR